jgi:hypothetical protein
MINPPQTTTGVNVIAAARAAAVATGDAKREDKKDESKDNEKQAVAVKNDSPAARSRGRSSSSSNEAAEEEKTTTTTTSNIVAEQKNKDAVINDVAAVSETENPFVKKLFKDKSETQQIGWMYESLSPNNRNYANVVMPLNTQALVVVTQDMQTNSWNFSAGKPQGQIVINQNFR